MMRSLSLVCMLLWMSACNESRQGQAELLAKVNAAANLDGTVSGGSDAADGAGMEDAPVSKDLDAADGPDGADAAEPVDSLGELAPEVVSADAASVSDGDVDDSEISAGDTAETLDMILSDVPADGFGDGENVLDGDAQGAAETAIDAVLADSIDSGGDLTTADSDAVSDGTGDPGSIGPDGDVASADSSEAGEIVDAGACSPGGCNDNDSCTTDGCDVGKGTCKFVSIPGCINLNAVGCGANGKACGGGKGVCSAGHCFWTDAKGYKWTLVPAGPFWMGCNPAVSTLCQYLSAWSPQHIVETSAYWIGVYEVTVANYSSYCKSVGAACTEPANLNVTKSNIAPTWNVPGKEQHPVNYVTWQQSRAFCQWLGGDLPSEASWEKAARGGCESFPGKDCAKSAPIYAWGNTPPVCGSNAVYSTTGIGCNTGFPFAVGTGSANGQSPYGAYDMIGNVAERVLDSYDEGFYASEAASQKDAVNPKLSDCHVFRGGSCGTDVETLESFRRTDDCPYLNSYKGQVYFIGARCARSYP